MIIKYLSSILLNFFDFFHKKKLIKFLKKENISSINILFDIGAHKGESIDFFSRNLNIKKIYSFEASSENFETLKRKYNNNENYIIENIALSSSNETKSFNQCNESSSSTFSKINKNSVYYKKKLKYFNFGKENNFFKEKFVKTKTLEDYIDEKNIKFIDLIKIDTEGHEFEILKGLKNEIYKVNTIIFEHHYDDMLKKNYTFSMINNYLKKKSFKKVFKLKMPFRKSFEYIYIKDKN